MTAENISAREVTMCAILGGDRADPGQRYTPSSAKMAHIPDTPLQESEIQHQTQPENAMAINFVKKTGL